MQSFRYLFPAPEERRAQLIQTAGTGIAFVMIALFAGRVADAALRATLLGICAASFLLVARAVWALESKVRRAEKQEIVVDETGICFVDPDSADLSVTWREIETCEVRGGKLRLEWKDGAKALHREISAREIENGVQLIEAIARFWNDAHGRPQKLIIPLTPR